VCPGQKLTQLEGPRKAVVEAWELDLICSRWLDLAQTCR